MRRCSISSLKSFCPFRKSKPLIGTATENHHLPVCEVSAFNFVTYLPSKFIKIAKFHCFLAARFLQTELNPIFRGFCCLRHLVQKIQHLKMMSNRQTIGSRAREPLPAASCGRPLRTSRTLALGAQATARWAGQASAQRACAPPSRTKALRGRSYAVKVVAFRSGQIQQGSSAPAPCN